MIICQLDGKNTHHGLGTIAIATTKNQVDVRDPALNRMPIPGEKLQLVNEVIKDKGIPIEQHIPTRVSALSTFKLKPVNDLRLTLQNKNWSSLDLLWHKAYFFHNDQPGWSGYMQSSTTGTYSQKSHITFLQIVDLRASNPTAIYSLVQ